MITPRQQIFRELVLRGNLLDESVLERLLNAVPDPEEAIQYLLRKRLLSKEQATSLSDEYQQRNAQRPEGEPVRADQPIVVPPPLDAPRSEPAPQPQPPALAQPSTQTRPSAPAIPPRPGAAHQPSAAPVPPTPPPSAQPVSAAKRPTQPAPIKPSPPKDDFDALIDDILND